VRDIDLPSYVRLFASERNCAIVTYRMRAAFL